MKISVIVLSLLLSLNTFAECLDLSGEYLSSAYGGTVEEIIQTDCDKMTILVKTIETNEIIVRFDWRTDGTLQRNLASDEFIYGIHSKDFFEWNLFDQGRGAVTKAKEYLNEKGDLVRELTLIDRYGYEQYQTKTLRRFK